MVLNKTTCCYILLLLFTCSCVKDVDFSGAYEKKVVVNCIIRARAKTSHYWRSPEELHPEIQRLYLYYNSNDGGKPIKLEQALAKLYNNSTGEVIGEFNRVSDYEWQLNYLPVFEVNGNTKSYNLDYRLEITDIYGEEKITANASLHRKVNTSAFYRSDVEPFLYEQHELIDGPVWFVPESYLANRALSFMPIFEKRVGVESLWTTYQYTDVFNYDGVNGYSRAVRLLPTNLLPTPFLINCKSDNDPTPDKTQITEYLLSYVSPEYDTFLKESIQYEMRHNDKSDPLQHLYEDLVFSNIEGGVGIFGVEVAYIFSRWEDYNHQ